MNGARTVPARAAVLVASACAGGCARFHGEAAALQSALHPATLDAGAIAQIGWIMFAAGALIFAAVMLLFVLALRRAGRPVRPAAWVLGAGVAFPAAVLSALLTYSVWRSAELTRPLSQQQLIVAVSARMWWWEVRYRDPGTGRDIVLANEIRLPAGRPVYLALTTSDVIHSFWVPALAGKIDMVPGRVHGLTVKVPAPGTWRGQCAEYCGAQHARMALHVVAQAPAEFDAWFANQRRPAMPPADAFLARGRQAFLDARCSACHTVRGVAEDARLGPDLTHVGSRLYLGAGTLRNAHGAMAGWIADPHAHKPGVKMPATQRLDGESLRALAAWLESLT